MAATAHSELTVRPAEFPRELEAVRAVYLEYEKGTGISLCFQGFEQEVATLPGKYAPPAGRLLLAVNRGDIAGCVALRPLEPTICEMKRLYVRPSHRGHGVGRMLAARLIDEARAIGYEAMRLDTLETWVPAVELYRSLGFKPTPRYNNDPDPHTMFMALRLR